MELDVYIYISLASLEFVSLFLMQVRKSMQHKFCESYLSSQVTVISDRYVS